MESCELLLSLDEPTDIDGCSTGNRYCRKTSAGFRGTQSGRRESALAVLLKAPAFRQYSSEMNDLRSMSRQSLVELLRTSLCNAARHDFSTYIDSRQKLGFSTRRYFSHDRDVILTSSGEDFADDDVAKHMIRCGRVWNSHRTFRMPTFAEFLAEGVAERRGNRPTLRRDDQRSNFKVTQVQGQHSEVAYSRLDGNSLGSRSSKETRNKAPSSVIVQNVQIVDNDSRASLPPDVTESHNPTERRDSQEYDPSIWDFLSSAPDDDEEDNDDDDADDDGGAVTQISYLSPREADVRPMKHAQAVREIVETEISYGNDLAIIKREFYDALKSNCLLNEEQLQAAFLNLPELISVSSYFTKRLQATTGLDRRNEPLDYKRLTESRVGRAFLDSTHMLLAFETYCVNQCTAALLVDQLTQERDVLRVFLDQLQKERPALRKMDLKSFLMLPVQRVTKYPLLLDRLLKLTPDNHPDRDDILLARRYVQETLSVINAKAISSLKMKRRSAAALWPKKNLALENIEITQVALELLRWNRSETHFLLVGRVFYSPLNNFRSVREPVHCVVATVGLMSPRENSSAVEARHLLFPRPSSLRSAAVVIVKKDRSGKYAPVQDPVMLERSVVSIEAGSATYIIELHEMNRDSCFIKTEIPGEMEAWLRQLRTLALSLGAWRRRRYALANVMTHRHELEQVPS